MVESGSGRKFLRVTCLAGPRALVAAAPFETGCSLIFVDGPAPVAPNSTTVPCTTSPAFSIVDLGISLGAMPQEGPNRSGAVLWCGGTDLVGH